MENVSNLAVPIPHSGRPTINFHGLLPFCELLNPARHLLPGCIEPIGIP
jgi:hypothetical protein